MSGVQEPQDAPTMTVGRLQKPIRLSGEFGMRIQYAGAVVLLLMLFIISRQAVWQGGNDIYSLLEIISFVLLFIASFFTFVRYYAKPSFGLRYLGSAFFIAAALEAFHGLVTSASFMELMPNTARGDLGEASWLFARGTLALLMLLGVVFARRQLLRGVARRISDVVVQVLTSTITLGVLIVLPWVRLPDLRSFGWVVQPLELIPGGLFLAAAVLLYLHGRWRYDVFQHWLVLSLILASGAHLLFAAASASAHDYASGASQVLTVLSHACLIFGIGVATFRATRDLDQLQRILARQKSELAAEKTLLREMLDALPVGVYVIQPDGFVTLVNQRMAELVRGLEIPAGGDRLNLKDIGESYPVFRGDGTPYPTHEMPLIVALRTGQPATDNEGMVLVAPDGKKYDLKTSSVPVHAEDGSIRYVINVIEDITREKEIERAKSEFVSLASHQLRTPLSTMNWYLEMMLGGDSGKVTKKQRQYLQDMRLTADRLRKLVSDLLNISRIEMGTMAVAPSETPLAAVIGASLKDMEPTINTRGLHVSVAYDAEPPTVVADPKLLSVIVDNLLTNAVRYSKDGGEIEVHVSRNEGMLVFAVRDHGCGIPEEDKPHVFEKMYRAKNAASVAPDGSGIGLYMVRGILEKVGGSIEFVSKENEGTAFTARFPLRWEAQERRASKR